MARLIILVSVALGLGWILAELYRAPQGHEDDNGFHKK
jgi:hypothetical protein